MELIIAEKPSVARDLARALGVKPSGRGAFEGQGRVITWCVGHLVELDEPAAYDGRWKAWRLDTLPMLPGAFKLRPAKHARDQLQTVARLLRDRRFDSVVNACDAGREGELIFRYVVQYAGGAPPAKRLWISSLTDEAIRHGFATLRPAAQLDPLADAARSRSEADWLVGMNATRAVTVQRRGAGGDTLYSIGRVQTPTLAMLVAREQAIRAFVPRDYWEVQASFTTAQGERFTARWAHGRMSQLDSARLAEALVARCAAHGAAADPLGPRVESVRGTVVREPPPLLFDLTSLQRTANRRFGFSAQRTLDLAQSLYERHKLLTYPRTDSQHLTADVAKELPRLFGSLAGVPEYAGFVQPLLDQPPRPSKRVVDDSKVQDHHAIIPTGKPFRLDALDVDERRLLDLVVRRFLGAFHPDAEFAENEAIIRVGGPGRRPKDTGAPAVKDADGKPALYGELPAPPDWFVARGRTRVKPGWQAVAGIDGQGERGRDGAEATPLLPALGEQQALEGSFAPQAKKTLPPRRYNEATLLSAMESAGKALSDDELRAAMKDTGLGTPATRAAIIETLLKRGYAQRQARLIVPTATGEALIDHLPVPSLASAELTGAWEARLARIARGEDTRRSFMADIAAYVRETIDAIRTMPAAPGTPSPSRPSPAPAAPAAIAALACPRCRQGTLITGKRGWGCSRWRDGCQFVIWFETAGRTLSETQLRDLVQRGKTRRARFQPGEGRLVLDPASTGGARFEPG